MDNDSSSEDEVFFGPVTNKEKRIAARHHGRKTLILPQRNPLYHRWSTTHIPNAFTTREDEIHLPSPADTLDIMDSPSQDCHSHHLGQNHSRTDISPLLSLDVRTNEDSKISSKSDRNSFEASQQGMTSPSLTNSSCYSSMGNFADDESSIYSTKLGSSSFPQSPTSVEAAQKHEQYFIISPSHHSPASSQITTSKNTVTILHCDSVTPVLPKESVQQDNLSHHYDQFSPHSPTLDTKNLVSTSDILAYSALTEHNKTSTVFSKDLSDTVIEQNVRYRKAYYHIRESSYKDPDFRTKECSNNGTVPSYSLRHPLENYSEPSCNFNKFECHTRNPLRNPKESDSSEVFDNLRKSPSILRVSNFKISEASCNSKEFDCSVSNSPSTSRETDSQDICIPKEPDCNLSESPNNSRDPNCTKNEFHSFLRAPETEPDVTVSESSNISTKPDTAVNESSNIFTKPGATVNESSSIATKPDNESPDIPREPDDTISQSPIISRVRDASVSRSLSIPNDPNPIVNESTKIPKKPDCNQYHSGSRNYNCIYKDLDSALRKPGSGVNETLSCSSEPDCIQREPVNTHKRYQCSLKEVDFNLRDPKCCLIQGEAECTSKESCSTPKDSDCSHGELHINLDNPDGSPKELVIGELNNSMEPLNSVRNLNDTSIESNPQSSFQASPRFNDTLEEIELFMKYGMNYGEGETSSMQGHQEYDVSPNHSLREPECKLGAPCIPYKDSSNHRKSPQNIEKLSIKSKESLSIPREYNCSLTEFHYQISEPKSSFLGHCINPMESMISHGKPNYSSMEALTSPEKLGDSHEELYASTSFPISPKFYDSLEEKEQIRKYGMDNGGKGTFPSHGSQEYTTPPHNSCSNKRQPPIQSNQTLASFAEVVHVEDKNSSVATLGLKESYGSSLQMEGTPLCPISRANTLHDNNMQNVPPLAKSATQLGLTRPTQRVTPTSRAPLSLPRSQPVGKGRTAAIKTTPILRLGKSSSSHTPTTSRVQQSQTAPVKLHLNSPAPRFTGLPPHPQRKAAVKHFGPKKTQTTTIDGLHHRGLWHHNVASPLAKELRNNPPPPLVTNVKSSSFTPGRWQPSPSSSYQPSSQLSSCNLSKGSKAQMVTAESTPNPQVCLSGKDDQVLPVANYKTGKSIILDNKYNKENIKRQCCKKTVPTKEVKVIKHAGRLMVAKSQAISQSRQSEHTSLMEVSIHQPVSSD